MPRVTDFFLLLALSKAIAFDLLMASILYPLRRSALARTAGRAALVVVCCPNAVGPGAFSAFVELSVTAITPNCWSESDQKAIREQLVRILNSGPFHQSQRRRRRRFGGRVWEPSRCEGPCSS